MSRLRVLLVFGTRPEAIKMAPLVGECRRRSNSIETVVCVTGQHRRLLDQVIDYFRLPVDLDLRLMRPDQSLAEITSRCLQGLDAALVTYQPGCVIAQGDTTTAMAAALAAFYRRVPLVHVEAGLRTGNLHAPWPEEFNRRAADLLASLHCAPSRRAAENLLAEGVPPERVHVTGNTVIDALLWTMAKERAPDAPWRKKYAALGRRRMVLVTAHRRENFGEGMRRICRAVAALADRFPDVEFVYPVHPNPNVRRPVTRLLAGPRGEKGERGRGKAEGNWPSTVGSIQPSAFSIQHSAFGTERPRPSRHRRIHLVRPTPYPEFVWLMDRATLILTDSGGVQEEALSLHKPVLVLRETTERGEALEAGAAELVGTNVERIVARASTLLLDRRTDAARRISANPYGDGKAAARIVDLVLRQSWHRRTLPIHPGLAKSA